MKASLSASIVFFLIINCASSDSNIRRPLDRFVRHFEHIHYDKNKLMYHHHRVRKSISADKRIMLNFDAFERQFHLSLYPDDKFIDKDASFYNSKGEVSKSHMKSYLYSGHDNNDPSVKVIGNLAFGVFDGRIRDGEEVYYIEPSSRYLNESAAESHSIIYRVSDVDVSGAFRDHPSATPCGATTRTQQQTLASLIKSNVKKRLHKRQANSDLVRCPLSVIADYKFYNALTTSGETVSFRSAQAASLIRTFIGEGSENFERQDFNGDGVPDEVQFSIFNLTVETDEPMEAPFNESFLGAAAFLNEHSKADWSEYCLSYRFTYRDFDQGVLGLAFVASSGARGGICDDVDDDSQTYNTGIVTLLNFNSRVSNAVAGLTFTHEAGHNFGSQHDPDTDECQPSNSNGGKFVMFDRANDGSRSNNQNFSPCSRRMMLTQIEEKGQKSDGGCFTTAEDDCGNNVLDEGEVCDCGLNFNCTTLLCNDDPCCNGSSCKVANDVECSPREGNCCSDNCTFISKGTSCREEKECAFAQTCNGSSAVCPTSPPRPSNDSLRCTTDNDMTRYCVDGACTGSVCVPLGLADCECGQEEEQCHVCCILDGTCESSITIAENNETARSLLPNGQGQVLEVGFPCNDFNGYCDFFNMCQLIDTEGALKRLTNEFLNSESFETIVNFFREYTSWWVPIVGAVIIVILLFLFVLVCHFILPRPKHMKNRSERRKRIRKARNRVEDDVTEF